MWRPGRGWWLVSVLAVALGGGCASEPPRFLYAVGGSAVAAYTIDAKTGALTAIAGSPFTIPDRANGGAAVSPSGRFLYVGHRSSVAGRGAPAVPGSISVFAIASSGALKAGPSYPADGDVRSIVLAPDGHFLYAVQSITTHDNGASRFTSALSAFRINATSGALTPAGPPVLTVRGLALDPSGRFAYVLRFDEQAAGDHELVTYPIDGASGALARTPVAEVPLPVGERGERLAMAPSGRVLYVLLARRQVSHGQARDGRFHWVGGVAVYTVDPATGALTAAPDASGLVGAASYARSFALAPSGRFLFIADDETPPIDLGSVWGYETEPTTGGLAPLRGSPVRAAMHASAVTVDRSDRFLYVTSIGPSAKLSGSLWAYAIDGRRGGLTPVPGVPFATAPGPTAVVTAVRAW